MFSVKMFGGYVMIQLWFIKYKNYFGVMIHKKCLLKIMYKFTNTSIEDSKKKELQYFVILTS